MDKTTTTRTTSPWSRIGSILVRDGAAPSGWRRQIICADSPIVERIDIVGPNGAVCVVDSGKPGQPLCAARRADAELIEDAPRLQALLGLMP